MIPPGSGKDSIKIKADYVEGMSCTSINAGVHAQYNHFDNKQVMCGKRANDVCEVDSQCAHIICSNNQTALSEQYEESVCVPRDTDRERRVEVCGYSGLTLTSEGLYPAEGYGILAYVLAGVGAFICCICTCSCYYNIKIRSQPHDEEPLPIPAFCPDCLFPKRDA